MRHATFLSLFAGAAVTLSGANVARAESQALAGASEDEVRALVAEMISDAETRTSLLQSGGGAGHDGKFFLASPDGAFRLNVGGQVQFRYALIFRDDGAFDTDGDGVEDTTVDDFESGFQTRRTKLIFDGHVFEPELFYKVVGAFDRDGGAFELEDAYVGYDLGDGFKVRWGQFKLPMLREELVSSAYQLGWERSPTNEFFSQNRSQGIEASYEAEMWRAAAAFSDGMNSENTDFAADPAGYAFTARGELLLMGEWSQFKDFTSQQGSDMGLMIGGAAHFEGGNDTGDNTVETDIFQFTLDASLEGDGWNLFAAFIGRNATDQDLDGDPTTSEGDSFDIGYVIQGGIYVSEELEVFARWDHTEFDEDLPNGNSDFKTVTAGVNYYLHGHAAKFTGGVSWYLDNVPGLFDTSGLPLLGPSDEDQFAIVFQFQLLF